jgi:RhoGAP domain
VPEAILTNNLHPLFEAAVARELETNPSAAMTAMKAGTRQPGLPSSPKSNMTTPIRKPPSLSTLAMPSFSGMPAASSTLVRNLRSLIARLPQENRDLIRTIVQLMRATYHASKETKMPLSNLLLVFCPSLNMTPPLLKALCECEEIWSQPSSEGAEPIMEIKRHTVVLDIKPTEQKSVQRKEQREEVETPIIQSQPVEQSVVESPIDVESPESHPSRPPVPTIYLDTESHHSSSSFSSVQEIEARYDASMPSPPPLSSSAESVVTPTSSTGHSSIHQIPVSDGDMKGKLSRKSSANDLLHPDDGAQVIHRLERRTNSEGTGSGQGPVEFPSISAPLPTAQKRRSLALLSLSSFSAISPASSSSQDSEERSLRDKKPSLRRLFTKRSTASLVSNHSGAARSSIPLQHTPSTPRTASSSTVSTPISAVTAPQFSASMLPPVLDMHIDTGTSLSFDLGFDVDDSSDDLPSQFTSSQAESVVYASAVTSQVSLFAQDEPKHPYGRGRSESTASTASSNHLGYEDSQEDEDWMKTVLAAACGDKI